MIVLNENSELRIKLAGAVTTNQLPVRVSYSDKTTAYNGANQSSETNDTTEIVICDTPAAGVVRDIDNVEVRNADTVNAQVYIIYDDNGTLYESPVVLLSPDDLLQYSHADNWKVITSDGSTKGVGATGPAGPGVPAGGTTDQVLAKVDGTNYNCYWKDDSNDVFPIATAAGTADAITATYSPALTLTDKQLCAFVATAANATTTPTFSPNGLTAHTIVKQGGVALAAGDIPGALAVCMLEYNLANTRWELLNPASSSSVPSLTASEVAYGDASNLITSDSDFTRDPATLDTRIKVGNVYELLGSQSGYEVAIIRYDAVTMEATFAIGDLTGLGQPAFFAMLSIEDPINNFINLLKVKEDSTINEITDGTATASIHNTLAHVHISFTDGVDLYEVGVDGTGIFLTGVPLSASGDDQMLVWDNVTGYVGYRALPATTNIYTADGTLLANRTVTLDGKTLVFTDTSGALFTIDPVLFYTLISATNGTAYSGLNLSGAGVGGTSFQLSTTDGLIPSPVLVDANGETAILRFAAGNGIFAENEFFIGLISSLAGKLTFYNASNTNTISFLSGVTASNLVFTLPTTDSTGTQALVSNGSGILGWATIPGAATTLYSGDGTLASDRTVTLNSKFLKIANAFGNLLEIDPVGLYTGIQAYNGSRVATLDLYSGASGDTITKFRLYAYKTTDVQIEGDADAQTLDFRATNGLTVTTGLSSSASVNDTMVVFDTSTKQLNYRALPTSGITRSVSSISSPTTAGATALTDYVYLVSGTTTLTLPTAVGNTNRYTIKRVGTNTVTIATTSSQTIDGSLTASLLVQYVSIDVISDGTNWNVI